MIKSKFFFLIILIAAVQFAFAQPASLYINEFMASNVLAFENPSGDYEDWIEIYNSGASPVDLAGYYLTDDLKNYWKIPAGQASLTTVPAKGYLLLYADGQSKKGANHLGFKLDKNIGEQLVLIDKDGVSVLDRIAIWDQFRDISYGRYPDGGSQWVYFTEFTPGAANKQGYIGFVSPPMIDQTAGFYNGSVTISVRPARTGDIIRYTLDGSDPTETSPQYITPVQINQTSIFKARAFNFGALPSEIVTRAFLVNANHALPVLALMTDPKNLFDPKTGIYVNDGDGRAWERFSELEYFKNQAIGFHAPAGLRIQGNTGPKDYRKKSLRAFFRDGYGLESLKYVLYPKEAVNTFNRLVFRAGYDDSMEDGKNARATLLRDPLTAELWQRAGGLTPHSSFAVLYLNNYFNGIYDIKESIEEEFIRHHLGYVELDLMRTRWDSTELVYGSRTKWNELIRFFQNNTFESDAKIAEAAQLLDLENFTTLQALIHATEYRSWAYGVFMFREKTDAARWQWTVWDADRSFDDLLWNGFTTQYNPLAIYLDGLITKKLLQNQSYKNKFINRIADLLNTVFLPANVKALVDSLANTIAPEIPAEVSRWNSTVAQWNQNVDWLRDFVDQRPAIVRQQMQDYFRLDSPADLTVGIESGKGKIKINTVTVSQFPWTGKYFRNLPITVTAIPEPGYRFDRWSDASLPTTVSITLNLTGDKSLSAIFTQLGNINAELIVPNRIKSGQHLPVVVRIRDASWNINPIEQTPMQIAFGGAHADTVIAIKRGAGTGVIQINAATNFTLSVQNAKVPLTQKQIEISSVPTLSYSGTLPTGEVVWDNTADRLITGHLTIPVGCRLTIKPGTWVMVKKYVNFYVQGQLTVEGTASAPVVITSENWSEPWGGMEFDHATASFRYCMVLNGGGDLSKGYPTNDGWHTGHQHIFFGKNDSEFNFDQCFFLYSPGKVFGAQDSKVTVTNSVSSFVWLGGEFHRVLLFYQNSHLMNLPNDDHIYTEDIDTDGFHIDYVNPKYPQYSVIDRCYFITGKDDAIDHHFARLRISNCWLEDFVHEGVAASAGDTVKIFNTVAMKNDQGFEAGWTESGVSKGPIVLIDHCVAIENNVGLRIGDSYSWSYRNFMKVTNTILYNNKDNIWNYLNSTHAPLEGALDISYSMTNDADYDKSPHCITGVPQFDPFYYILPGSPGTNMGTRGTNMGRADSAASNTGAVVINEIMYNSPPEMDAKDWIELYNPQAISQPLSGWILRDEDVTHQFRIPFSAIIPAGGYWVLCGDTSAFKRFHPEVKNISGNISFGFGGKDQVRLYTSVGLLVDSVAYDNDPPWPVDADGKGYSLELIVPSSDHALPQSWAKSIQFGGTPGRANRVTGVESRPENNLPTHFVLQQNYPNPFNPRTRIVYAIPKTGKVRLLVFDLLGQKVLDLVDNQRQSAGRYSVELDGRNLPTGVYLYQVQFVDENGAKQKLTKKMVLIK
ncbi:MAG: CotH kinase family protein [candidate division KSB1 bacterium]|nr:CotH kinase family protein [candidate division KSB1 bacterium]MDZ7300582.1 CotH kinase family protein [candidate division KSB1 bacterium]MDZ7309719.1 CotH kinase family protein [candidate division KSB1 bacterium]